MVLLAATCDGRRHGAREERQDDLYAGRKFCETLMRDFVAVALLAVGLGEAALAALAVDASGGAEAAPPARRATPVRAVDLAPVAAAAQEEDLPAVGPEAGDAAHRLHDGPRRGTARNLPRTCGRATKKAPRSSHCGLRARRRHPPGSRSMGPRTSALPRPGPGREFSATPPPLRLAVRNHAVSGARQHLRPGRDHAASPPRPLAASNPPARVCCTANDGEVTRWPVTSRPSSPRRSSARTHPCQSSRHWCRR